VKMSTKTPVILNKMAQHECVHAPANESTWKVCWKFGPYQTYRIKNTCMFLLTNLCGKLVGGSGLTKTVGLRMCACS
jgi:hypothetical protein